MSRGCFLSPGWAWKVVCVSVTRCGRVRYLAASSQDAASFEAEPSSRGPASQPEPVYSREAADYREAGGQQGLAYAPEAVYDSTEAPGHYQGGKRVSCVAPGLRAHKFHYLRSSENCLPSLSTGLCPSRVPARSSSPAATGFGHQGPWHGLLWGSSKLARSGVAGQGRCEGSGSCCPLRRSLGASPVRGAQLQEARCVGSIKMASDPEV